MGPRIRISALIARGERQKQSETNRYVTLYQPQPLGGNCALLFLPGPACSEARVHLHAWSIPPRANDGRRACWRDDVYRNIEPTLELVRPEDDTSQGFSQFRVVDWEGFAAALELRHAAAIPN